MIENTAQLQQALEQMGRMQRILDSYRADILPKSPRNFAVFAEGPLDEIRKLRIPAFWEKANSWMAIHCWPASVFPSRNSSGPGLRVVTL